MSRDNTISRRKLLAGMGASAVVGLQPGRARAADPITLKFGTNDTPQDASYTIGQRFGAEVAKRTNDKYRVQVYAAGALGSGVNVVSSLQTGIVDCAIITTGFLASFVPSVQVVDLPFLFKDRATAERVLDGDVGKKLFADMDARNIVGLTWGWYGWRQVETREKAVTAPDDMKGLKMRIQPSPIFAAMLKAVGAIPVVMDGTEVYLALSQKTIDGVEFPLPTVVTFKMYEVNKFLALTNHVYNAGVLMVSKARWAQMTPADREAFQGAATALQPVWRNEIASSSEKASQFCKEHGMTITETNFKAFQAKMEPVYTEFKPKYLDLFNMIMAQQ